MTKTLQSKSIRRFALLEHLSIFRRPRDPNDRRHVVITLDDDFRDEFLEYLDGIMGELFCIPKAPHDSAPTGT